MKVFPVELLIDGKKVLYRFTEDFDIHDYKIPKGFVTDGASVPRIFWTLFPPVFDYFGASVIHDYLIQTKSDWKDAETEFKRYLKRDGIGVIRVFLMLNAVRIGGIFKGKRSLF